MSYTHYYPNSQMLHGALPLIMGTRLDALILGKDEVKALEIWKSIIEELNRLHKLLNRFDPLSEIANINRQAIEHPVKVSEEIMAILKDCRRYHALTCGCFDITLYDFNKLTINTEEQTVFFNENPLTLDLGGYGKGYALQQVEKILKKNGILQAFINFGNSSVLALGRHPHGEAWSVGIENPYSPGQILKSVKLCDNSLSTSGNMPQHSQHIINPLTGEYTDERKLVSVISANAVDAEVLTTALMVADEQTEELILRNFNQITKYTFRLK